MNGSELVPSRNFLQDATPLPTGSNVGTRELSTASRLLVVRLLVGAVTLTAPAEPPIDAAAAKRPELGLIVEVRTNE